jgi:hypothetical protein
MKQNLIITILVSITSFFLCSCQEKEGPAESAGKEIDRVIENWIK